jgi:hypothetical protein
MIVFDHISLDKAVFIDIVIDVRVNNWVLEHRNGACFHEKRQHSQILMDLFHLFAERNQFSAVHLI